ncbi:hypothetical protein [Actinomadura madurae]|uniref:hypothetical protein n=1 Tax=Actinomadura madurae TaxID=1993 RepID=UPI002026B2BB|nr:hypothetical protein [Actinomadura madurae]MCP9978911.1 hypothetical protein [Actinomadura madurae]MCQ0009561.1 hypothetical protein [Actinomadura madurae]MCQ0015098.1 hypothetical protein [Actinomadura madurae]URM95237.1 hypothetical protein LUW76_13455 [Actinomadura madurae]
MVSDRRVGYLEELEHELDTRGLVARVVRTRSGPAFLRVVNPEAASLAEDVTCAPAPETADHYFWWSWGSACTTSTTWAAPPSSWRTSSSRSATR